MCANVLVPMGCSISFVSGMLFCTMPCVNEYGLWTRVGLLSEEEVADPAAEAAEVALGGCWKDCVLGRLR